ncbi:CoA transferase subunit A [Mesobacillus zeae]|uniref:CoA transferase subunit A n=1 Tax=Mesobacillus zeae TaxID=1917180 RepID=A0A398B8M7_9BACI|nr:CoA-transferase [Mesobacillus zeae]RID84260.1 CoA transferase subunit A [Mesobacillus zeae]
MKKVMCLNKAAGMVRDGDTISFGGNVLHRVPMAFVREIARQKKQELKIVKTAGAHDIDLLCAMDSVTSVDAGFVSYETKFGLASHYRRAVQEGRVKGNEHACYTVICALRGAQMNVPFMPVKGLVAGELLEKNDYFMVVEDPFSGNPITLVKTIVPDVAVIHVQECDQNGNARIYGPKFEDVLLSRAAKKVIITTEQVVPAGMMKRNAEYVDIPSFLVSAVVHTPRGAAPASCPGKYDIDETSLISFLGMKTKEEIEGYLSDYSSRDHSGERTALRI